MKNQMIPNETSNIFPFLNKMKNIQVQDHIPKISGKYTKSKLSLIKRKQLRVSDADNIRIIN